MNDRTNGHGVVRLALNVPAVERLLAGDPELEIAMRKQVAEQVFKNMADRVMAHPSIKGLEDKLAEELKRQWEGVIGRSAGYHSSQKLVLSATFQGHLNKAIRDLLEPTVRSMVEDHTRRLTGEWLALAEPMVQRKFDEAIEKRIQDGISQRLAAAAKA